MQYTSHATHALASYPRPLPLLVNRLVEKSSGVYSGGLWGLEHPPVLPANYETNLAISSTGLAILANCAANYIGNLFLYKS